MVGHFERSRGRYEEREREEMKNLFGHLFGSDFFRREREELIYEW